eukprot:126426-Chlamydomonas_euryale.AAC.1
MVGERLAMRGAAANRLSATAALISTLLSVCVCVGGGVEGGGGAGRGDARCGGQCPCKGGVGEGVGYPTRKKKSHCHTRRSTCSSSRAPGCMRYHPASLHPPIQNHAFTPSASPAAAAPPAACGTTQSRQVTTWHAPSRCPWHSGPPAPRTALAAASRPARRHAPCAARRRLLGAPAGDACRKGTMGKAGWPCGPRLGKA